MTYGIGIPAPWNSNDIAIPTAAGKKDPLAGGLKINVHLNGHGSTNGLSTSALTLGLHGDKDKGKAALPDARLFATWEHETKDYRDIKAVNRSKGTAAAAPTTKLGRVRLGSMTVNGNGVGVVAPSGGSSGLNLNLNVNGRTKQAK